MSDQRQDATYSARDAMRAFGMSRGKVEAYSKLGAATPTGPLRSRGRAYTYFDLLRVGLASHIEAVYKVSPRYLSLYTAQVVDEWLVTERRYATFDEFDGVPQLREVVTPDGNMRVLSGRSRSTGLTMDLVPIKDALDRYLRDCSTEGKEDSNAES